MSSGSRVGRRRPTGRGGRGNGSPEPGGNQSAPIARRPARRGRPKPSQAGDFVPDNVANTIALERGRGGSLDTPGSAEAVAVGTPQNTSRGQSAPGSAGAGSASSTMRSPSQFPQQYRWPQSVQISEDQGDDEVEVEEAARAAAARGWDDSARNDVQLQSAINLVGDEGLLDGFWNEGTDEEAVVHNVVAAHAPEVHTSRTGGGDPWREVPSTHPVEVVVDRTASFMDERLKDAVEELHNRFDLESALSVEKAIERLTERFLGRKSDIYRLLFKGSGLESEEEFDAFLATLTYFCATNTSAAAAFTDPRRKLNNLVDLDTWNSVWKSLGSVYDINGKVRPLGRDEKRSAHYTPLWILLQDAVNEAFKVFRLVHALASLDDDKLHFALLGLLAQSFDLALQFHAACRRLGYTAHTLVDVLTGLPMAFVWERAGMSINESMSCVVEFLARGGIHAQRFVAQMLGCDRAYEDSKTMEAFTQAEGAIFGTSRKTLGKPMAVGMPSEKRGPSDKRKFVPPTGTACLVEMQQSGKNRYEYVYRAGNGNATMLSAWTHPTHELSLRPRQFEFAGVRHRNVDRKIDSCFSWERSETGSEPAPIPDKYVHLFEQLECVAITQAGVQGGTVWKLARFFGITSSTAFSVFSVLERDPSSLPAEHGESLSLIFDLISARRSSAPSDSVDNADVAEPGAAAGTGDDEMVEAAADVLADLTDQDAAMPLAAADVQQVMVDIGVSEGVMLHPDASGVVAVPGEADGHDAVTADDRAKALLASEDIETALSDTVVDGLDDDVIRSLCEHAIGAKSPTPNGVMSRLANQVKEIKEWRDHPAATRHLRLLSLGDLKAEALRLRNEKGLTCSIPATKEPLFDRLKQLLTGGTIPGAVAAKTLADAVCEPMFLARVEGRARKEMLVGHATESHLARGLYEFKIAFPELDDRLACVILVGLLAVRDQRALKGSPDRVVVIRKHNDVDPGRRSRIAAVEIKTRVTIKTVGAEEQVRHDVCQKLKVDMETRSFVIDLRSKRRWRVAPLCRA